MYQINEKRIFDTFIDLVKISSPSWKEKEVIKYIMEVTKKLGFKTKKIKCKDSNNLLITVNGDSKKPTLLFSAHLDTVVPCENVKPIVTDKKISSDGTTILGSDDKSAIAIFLEGLFYLKENNINHGPIEILLSCAEELGLHGIKNFDLSILKSKYAFVFDSDGSIGKVVTKAPYHSKFDILIKGKAAHAGMEPEKGINAINVMAEIITKLPSGRLDDETTINIGVIEGGKATNIVAEEVRCNLEVRSTDNKKLKNVEKTVKDTVQQVSKKYGAKNKISYILEYSGFTIKENDKILKIVENAMAKIKIKPQYESSGGGSDTNIINKAGINAINLSCGMRNVHTKKEFIYKKDLVIGTKLMLSIIENV